ncbi:MAG: Aspartate kinase [Nitrospira sp.]
MKDGFTQSMDWLHTWGGLLFGWILFAIFLTGTLTVFDKEITYWMQPELHGIRTSPVNLQAAADQLARLAPRADEWWIELPHARTPELTISWQNPGEEQQEQRKLDPATGEILTVRETQGGEFFYRFHYQLHLDRLGTWIVGGTAMLMLVALVTGLVIHHRIFKDFFTFRHKASFHRSWLDAHNATGVLMLPFHVVITFTGLVIFWMIYMPAGVDVFYGGEFNKILQEVEQRVDAQRASIPAPLISLVALEQQAKTYWGEGVTEWIQVKHPGDLHARVEVVRRADDRLALISDRVTFDGATGKILNVWKGKSSAFVTYSVLLGLHYLWFDHAMIRWLYFFMGLTGSTMIATGLLLWVIKRKDSHAGNAAGYQIVESLNVAVVAGLPVAIAAFFWANRLWPLNVPGRAMWEMDTFFFLWALCVAHGFLRKDRSRAWKEQVRAAATLFAFLPLLNLMTAGNHLLVTLPVGNWRLAGIDLTCLAVGGLFYWIAWRVRRPAVAVSHATSAEIVEAG